MRRAVWNGYPAITRLENSIHERLWLLASVDDIRMLQLYSLSFLSFFQYTLAQTFSVYICKFKCLDLSSLPKFVPYKTLCLEQMCDLSEIGLHEVVVCSQDDPLTVKLSISSSTDSSVKEAHSIFGDVQLSFITFSCSPSLHLLSSSL